MHQRSKNRTFRMVLINCIYLSVLHVFRSGVYFLEVPPVTYYAF